ncbi:MAG: hypothetical protein ACYSU4_10495, partial [Planctomycetota bacterium]
NAGYEGTVANVAAQHRLETMDDYRQKVVFKPAPAPTPVGATQPTIQLQPVPATLPNDGNKTSQVPTILPEVNSKVPEPNAGE